MSDRHTADTITDDALDALYERLRKAERAADLLADAHRQAEQVEEPLPDGQHPATATPAQWLWLFNRAAPQEQLAWAERIIKAGQDAATCFLENHRTDVEEQRRRAEQAEADRKTLGQTALGYQQRAWDAEAELKQAQAALDRVRAAADKLADGTETGFRAALTIREAIDQPKEQPMQHEKHTPIGWKALAEQNERRWKDEGNRRAAAEAERDRAYRERAHLVALLAAMTDTAVLAPADDVDEPGWAILYLTLDGRQASWHISPNDGDLFDHVPVVTGPEHPGARWDGHTTEEKYRRIAEYTAQLAKARQT